MKEASARVKRGGRHKGPLALVAVCLALGLVVGCTSHGQLAQRPTLEGTTTSGRPSAQSGPAQARPPHFPLAGRILIPRLPVRSAPSPRARQLTELDQFRGDYRPTYVFAVGAAQDRYGWWYRISVPGRPNGRYGWVRAGAVYLTPVYQRLVVLVHSRRLALYDHGRRVFTTRVAVGRRGMETPTGRFYIAASYEGSEAVLGAWAFETSAYSKLSDWPGGGIVGIHGTDQPWLIGQNVSHGCVRMTNAAVLRLKDKLKLGAEVDILPG